MMNLTLNLNEAEVLELCALINEFGSDALLGALRASNLPEGRVMVYGKDGSVSIEPLDPAEVQEPDFLPPEDMDGDHQSALESCGWGTDEDYGYYGGGED